MTAPSRRGATGAGLAAIVLGGAALRSWRLGLPGLTSDEAFSWRLTRYGAGAMLRRAAADVHPPLYYLLLKGWLAAWGDAPEALRGLSVVLGLAVVLLAFALVKEAAVLEAPDRAPRLGAAAWLAAVLVAGHATQVAQSRNARMYALGCALAVLSAWMVLRARRGGTGWWLAWGLTAGAAVATHYYLAFTVAAQALWALVAAGPDRPRTTRRVLAAGVIALAALGPWLPALWRQARQVHEEYWIPPATTGSLLQGVARWARGVDVPRAAPWVVMMVAALLVLAARSGRAGRFFAVQAVGPWIFGLAVSALTGRPLVLDRYLVFAQVFLLCAAAVAATSFASPTARVACAAVLAGAVGWGTLDVVRTYPSEPPAMAVAARFLKRQAAPGERIAVDSPRALNKLRYYAHQAGGDGLDIRAVLPERVPLSPHVSHVVSLADGDAIAPDEVFTSEAATVWVGRETTAPPDLTHPRWTVTYARIFEGGEETRFALTRYQRAPPVP